jgi:hypothetical protein
MNIYDPRVLTDATVAYIEDGGDALEGTMRVGVCPEWHC